MNADAVKNQSVHLSERKEWASEVFRGAENSLLPSFTADFGALDEQGIRLDVQRSIQHGFFSMFCAGVGLTREERAQLVSVAVDEAAGRIGVSTGVGGNTPSEVIARLKEAEALGCTHVMLSLPAIEATEDELFAFTRKCVQETNLGIVLYATSGQQFRHLDPGNVLLDVFAKLAGLPNVVAVKLTQTMDAVTAFRCAERLGDKLLLGPVNLELAPFMATVCPLQFTGMWQVESHQSPERQYVVEYMRLLSEGRLDDAAAVYYRMEPLVKLFWEVQAPVLRKGGHPWTHLKYFQWCVGGNGGLMRPPTGAHQEEPVLTLSDRELIRETYRSVGIEPSRNDEEFQIGRAGYQSGLRIRDLSANPNYM